MLGPRIVAVFFAALAGAAAFEEVPAESRVASIDLFKNGLAVVRRTVEIPAPGIYRIDNVPEPVHGTFWIESDAEVVVRITSREVEEPVLRSPGAPDQSELAGRNVVVFFQDGGIPPVNGRVAAIEPVSGAAAWNRTYNQPDRYYGYYGSLYSGYSGGRGPQPGGGGFLILEREGGRSYVNAALIAHIQVEDKTGTVRRRRPVLLLSVSGESGKPAAVRITYLAKGMSWAPSYSVDTTDPAELVVRQKAVIRNELERIEQAEISLISGFPSIPFAHVTSPLSPRTDWARFFRELSQQFRPGHATTMNVISQQAVASNAPPEDSGLGLQVPAAWEGVDLHFQPIGRHTLVEGDSLSMDVASARAAYARVVEWIVPDNRNANGRYVNDYERDQNPEKYQDAAWDSLRFSNPFDFPMTTGPAAIVSNGRFHGQSTSMWISPGEETTLHITKALNVRTRSVEQEEEGEREIVYWGGNKYRKVQVKGFLVAANHRNESIELVIRRRFSGELVEAGRSPRCTLLEEGVYSVNVRNELAWNLSLKPGEEVEIIYRYSVLVPH